MGYSRHHAIVVTSWDEKHIELAHAKAREIFGDHVTEILPPATNGYRTFLIGPDGSKEWWPESDAGDKRRAEFRQWVETSKMWLDAAEMQYHDEESHLWIKGIPDVQPC
jgi:hypothetical protein